MLLPTFIGDIPKIWYDYFKFLDSIIIPNTRYGKTSERPIPTFIGQHFFDTDLGYPIYAKTLKPVVWVNASGVVV